MYILGLDVSTTTIGVSVIDYNGVNVLLAAIELSKLKDQKGKLIKKPTLWDKVDATESYLKTLQQQYPNITLVSIETALIRFSKGASSAQTISTLLKFNGIVQLLCRQIFRFIPDCTPCASARKVCGVKLLPRKKIGKSYKDQTFDWITTHQLLNHQFPLKKSGKIVDWAKDAVDAYVQAIAIGKMKHVLK